MCGIQAFVGKKNKQVDLNKFKKLMLWNALGRGQEATGIFSPENNIIKDNDRCDIFLGKNEIKPDSLMIGHVRASTYGGNTKDNAHPFKEGNITLVHNGTLTNPWPWARHHSIDTSKVNVDSHAICHILNKTQDFNVLGEINGAAALVMHDDKTPNRLYVYRNKDRELFYGLCSYGMYISSIKASLESIGCTDIAEFPVGTLHTIEYGAIKSIKQIESKPYETPVFTNTSSNTTTFKANQHTPTNLVGRWLYCDSASIKNCDQDTEIAYGKFYRCVGVTNELVNDNLMSTPRNYIYILDDKNIRRKVDFWGFDNYCSRLEKGDYAFITNDLYYSDKPDDKGERKLVLKKDQIVVINSDNEVDGKIAVHDGENPWNVPKGSIRKLTYNDEWIDGNHTIIAQLDYNYTKNQDKVNNFEKEENKEEEESDEDTNFYVDAEVLICNDFEYIKEKLNDVLDNYHNVSHYQIKDGIRDIIAHVENCIDEYTTLAVEQGVVFYEDDVKQEKILD